MNKSTIILTGILSLSALLSSCNPFDCVRGSRNLVTQNRKVEAFTKVETSGSTKVILKQSTDYGLRITADDNIQKEIETYVRGNTLIIDMDGNFCDSSPITIYVNSREYEGIYASGAVEILSDGKLTVKNFELDLRGSVKVDLDINAANMKTSSSGASEIFLKGQSGSHELELSGSSSVEALDFVVGRYRIENSGSSNSRINVLNELYISSSGSSDVEYRGSPSSIKNNESGASSLKKID